jgi:hypothetical protein
VQNVKVIMVIVVMMAALAVVTALAEDLAAVAAGVGVAMALDTVLA